MYSYLIHLVRPIGPFYFRFPPAFVCCTAAARVGVQDMYLCWHYHYPAIVGVRQFATVATLALPLYHSPSVVPDLSCLPVGAGMSLTGAMAIFPTFLYLHEEERWGGVSIGSEGNQEDHEGVGGFIVDR